MYAYKNITKIRDRLEKDLIKRSLFFKQRGSASVLTFIGHYNLRYRNYLSLSFLHHLEPPHLNWSSAMFRKRRTDNDEQTTEAGRDYHEVEAS